MFLKIRRQFPGLEAERQDIFHYIFDPISSVFMADSLRMCKKKKKSHCESALKVLISVPYPRNSEGKPRNMNFSKSLSDSEAGDSYTGKDSTLRGNPNSPV